MQNRAVRIMMSVAGLWGLIVVILYVLFGCAAVQPGPSVDLAAAAVPAVVSDPPPKLSADVPPPPPPPRSGFKIWIPRLVTPNGDVVEGHYVEVSDQSPPKLVAKPTYVVPTTPKHIPRAREQVTPVARSTAPTTPASTHPRATLPSTFSVLPGQGTMPQAPLLVPEVQHEFP